MMKLIRSVTLATALAALLFAPAQAEDVLSATTALPKTIIYSANFIKWIDRVNKEGKGIVRIDYRGGPEAIPMFEQGAAVRNGVVDMIHTPSNYYVGQVPETDAIVGGPIPRAETRKNGGFELLDQIHQKKMNVRLLANFEPNHNFHIYLRTPPKFKPDGMFDLSGVKIRGTPIYREFFAGLGATFINMAPAEVYTALERGAIDGVGWPRLGLMDAGWDKFLKFRLDPGFFQADLMVLVNLDKWKKLSPKSRELLEKLAIDYETESMQDNLERMAKEDAELKRRGLEVVALKAEPAKAFLAQAYNAAWERMKSRDPANVDTLRTKFYAAQ
jgi:TRAP-type transport system periplasmic protein